MSEKAKNKAVFGSRLLSWLLLIACLAGLPAALVFTTMARFYQVAEDELAFNLRMQMQQATDEALRNTSQEEFWCRHFHEKFVEFKDSAAEPGEIIAWLNSQRKLFPDEFEFGFWDATGKQLAMTLKSEYSNDEWREVFGVLCSYGPFLMPVNYSKKLGGSIEIARKVLGRQTLGQMFSGLTDPRAYCLAWLDSAGIKPLVASYFLSCGGAIIFIDQKRFGEYSGLKHVIKQFAEREQIMFGLIDRSTGKPETWHTGASQVSEEFLRVFSICEQKSLNYYELPGHYIGYQYLSPDLRLFVAVQRHLSQSAIYFRATLAALVFLLLMLPLIFYTWRTMVRQMPGRASIRRKLAFLFLFACGIPLLAMAIISQELYSHKRHTLMADARLNSVEMLLSFDRRYSSAVKDVGLSLDKFFADWRQKAHGLVLNEDLCNQVASHISKLDIENYFIISSSSQVIGARDGFIVYSGSMDDLRIDKQ
ncbi:MAG: hypothetical protein PHD82_02565, partial [Candidatus Riflebacteria bacterium]|nr:hypothetical protein [Candidatus Riflebacteria bacterium]